MACANFRPRQNSHDDIAKRAAEQMTSRNFLPVEFRADLPNARVARVGDYSKVRAGDISARIYKLRVVENVEEFETQIERESLIYRGSFEDSEIGVIEPRTVEESPIYVSERPRSRVQGECAWQEVASCGRRTPGIRITRINDLQGTRAIRHVRFTAAEE